MNSSAERIFFIDRMIRKHGKITVKEMAAHFETSERTIQRDIDSLKEIEAPIVFSKEKRGYIYSEPFELFKFADEKMTLFYVLLKKISESMIPYIPVVSEEILKECGKSITSRYRAIFDYVGYESPENEKCNIVFAAKVLESIACRTQLETIYKNSAGLSSSQILEPLYFLNYSGKWYLIAFCPKSSCKKNFLLSRFESIENTENSFENKISKEDVLDFIQSGFGIFKNTNITDVTIRFYEPVSQIVEKQIWHKNQLVTSGNKDGKTYMDLTLPVADYTEIIGKTLFYLPHAEPVSPPDFRAMWLEKLKTASEIFLEK